MKAQPAAEILTFKRRWGPCVVVKGSMELLDDRDPEDARKLLDSVVERMMEAVHSYEGCCDLGRDRWAMSPPYQQRKHGTPSLGAPFSPYEGRHRGD
jgi:hypothetical protein